MNKVQYRIEEGIFFCPNSVGFYHEKFEDEIVSISSPAARLFSFLIKNKGEIVKREVLLSKVWDDYGMQASNNNLNQCLSTLRRIIKNMGINKNIIETIPKVGLRIASDVAIEEINTVQEKPEITAPSKKEKRKGWNRINLIHCLITLVIVLITTTLVHFFHTYNHYQHAHANNGFIKSSNILCETPTSLTANTVPEWFSTHKPTTIN